MSKSKNFNSQTTNQNKQAFLSYDLFLESLSIAAMHMKIHEEFSDIEKIVYILDKMTLSSGISKTQMQTRTGKLMSNKMEFSLFVKSLKDNLPNFQNKEGLKLLLKSPTCFEDIFQ